MLSPPDAELSRRDHALPGLAVLLDSEAFVTHLREAVSGVSVEQVQPAYVRYKPGTSCLVGYRTEIGGPITLYAIARRSDDAAKLRKIYSGAAPSSTIDPGVCLLEEAVEVHGFPNDRSLTSLSRLADPASRFKLLGERFPGLPDLRGGELRTLAYKPERRYVGQLGANSSRSAVLRLYTEEGFRTARQPAKVFRSAGLLRVPRCLGRSVRHRMLLLEWLPGQPLSELLRNGTSRIAALESVGAALAELHAQPCPELHARPGGWDAASLRSTATAVTALCPQLGELAHRLSRRLAKLLEPQSASLCAIHGDLYADQVLITSETVAILDFDRARLGDPAADLGLFIAHLERDTLSGALPKSHLDPMCAALLTGYGVQPNGELSHRINVHTAVGLVGLAVDPFRRRAADWPTQIEQILVRALEICRSPSRDA